MRQNKVIKSQKAGAKKSKRQGQKQYRQQLKVDACKEQTKAQSPVTPVLHPEKQPSSSSAMDVDAQPVTRIQPPSKHQGEEHAKEESQKEATAKVVVLEESYHYLLRLFKSNELNHSRLPRGEEKDDLISYRNEVEKRANGVVETAREREWYRDQSTWATVMIGRNKAARQQQRDVLGSLALDVQDEVVKEIVKISKNQEDVISRDLVHKVHQTTTKLRDKVKRTSGSAATWNDINLLGPAFSSYGV